MNTVVDWKTRARTAHQQGNLSEAQKGYTNWLVESPDDPEALHGMGVCAIAEGRSQDAIGMFERAHELAPTNPHVLRNLGVAYWTLQRQAEALEALEGSDRLEPDNPHTQFNLAVALMGLGENERRVAFIERNDRRLVGYRKIFLVALDDPDLLDRVFSHRFKPLRCE